MLHKSDWKKDILPQWAASSGKEGKGWEKKKW